MAASLHHLGNPALIIRQGLQSLHFGRVSLMNYLFANFPFRITTALWFAGIYENEKEKNWASSPTSPYISHVIGKTRRKKEFGVCLSSGVSSLCIFSVFPLSKEIN